MFFFVKLTNVQRIILVLKREWRWMRGGNILEEKKWRRRTLYCKYFWKYKMQTHITMYLNYFDWNTNNAKKGIVMSLAFSFLFFLNWKVLPNEHKNNNQRRRRRRSAFFLSLSLLNRLGRVLACKQMVMNQNLKIRRRTKNE